MKVRAVTNGNVIELEDSVAEQLVGAGIYEYIDAPPPAVDATEAARELAEAEGVDLGAIEGTGAGGRVLVDDVREAIDAADEPADADDGDTSAEE